MTGEGRVRWRGEEGRGGGEREEAVLEVVSNTKASWAIVVYLHRIVYWGIIEHYRKGLALFFAKSDYLSTVYRRRLYPTIHTIYTSMSSI